MNIPKIVLDNFWMTGEVPQIPGIGRELEAALAAHLWNNVSRLIAAHREIHQVDVAARRSGELAPEGRERISTLARLLVNSAALMVNFPAQRWHGRKLNQRSASLEVLMLESAPEHISEEHLNFLGLRDTPDSVMGLMRSNKYNDAYLEDVREAVQSGRKTETPPELMATIEDIRLSEAFTRQMIAQVRSSSIARPFIGEFIMKRVPFPALDAWLSYEHLRLVITGWGLWFSFVTAQRDHYIFGWWSPEQDSIDFAFGSKETWMIRILMACIWRDACIVQKHFVTERSRGTYTYKAKHHQNSKLVLPRRIREVEWALDEERERIIHATHYVRGHYRELREGFLPSPDAVQNARSYGFADPPEGFTFVQPHKRGHGDAPLPQTREIICKGLQAARTALSHFA